MTPATPPRAGRVIPALLPDKLAAGETSPRFSHSRRVAQIGGPDRLGQLRMRPARLHAVLLMTSGQQDTAGLSHRGGRMRAGKLARNQSKSAHGGRFAGGQTAGVLSGGNTAPHAPGALTECATSCHRGRGQTSEGPNV